MPPLEDNRRRRELKGINHRELRPTNEMSIFAITNPNASERRGLSGRMPQSFPLQSANFLVRLPGTIHDQSQPDRRSICLCLRSLRLAGTYPR